MTPAFPESGGRPRQPTPEAWAMQAEWLHEPPSHARADAQRALEALARAPIDPAEDPMVDEVPPVPNALRDRWAEAYGRPTAVVGERARPSPVRGEESRGSVVHWLGVFMRSRRLAWAGAGAMAVVAMTWMFMPGGTDVGMVSNASMAPTTRGGGGDAPATDPATAPAPITLIVSAAAEREKSDLLAVIDQAFPGRTVHVVATADEAAAWARRAPHLVVVNVASGLVTAWAGGQLADEFPAAGGRPAAGVITQIESADERLQVTEPTLR